MHASAYKIDAFGHKRAAFTRKTNAFGHSGTASTHKTKACREYANACRCTYVSLGNR
jgi:hypothetical protein